MPRCDLCHRPALRVFLCFKHWLRVPESLRHKFDAAEFEEGKLLASAAISEWAKRQPKEIESRRDWPSAG